MATITAKDVNELRQQTGAGLMDCKKALTEAEGDLQSAIDILRKKGQKVSELRAGREANEGAVIAKTNADNTVGVIVHLSSETDFVAKNEDFIAFANQLADLALNNDVKSLDELMSTNIEGVTVKDKLAEKVGAIGENIGIPTYERVDSEAVIPYIHAGNKIGVLVCFNQPANDAIAGIGRDIAMQIAAMRPVAVDENGVDQATKDREMTIGREQAIAEGKPENIVDKIAEGKLNRFYKDNTLLHQAFVKDSSKNVAQVLKETSADLKVKSFKRVELGGN